VLPNVLNFSQDYHQFKRAYEAAAHQKIKKVFLFSNFFFKVMKGLY